MKNKIEKALKAINDAHRWEVNLDESKQYAWKKKLVHIQRQLTDLRYALEENRSVAAFGESQMGKSYLIGALLSEPGVPFCVDGGDRAYNFKREINPSLPNSSVEATGVVTRFSAAKADGDQAPKGWVKIRMLTVADIVLVLAEAYYVQVRRTLRNTNDIRNHIEECIAACHIGTNDNPLISEVDVAEIEDYLRSSLTIAANCENILSTNLFQFLLQHVNHLSNSDIVQLLKLIWNNNVDFNRLFDDLLDTYRQLDLQRVNYIDFRSVLRSYGTLLDVARLDEMYSPTEMGNEYEPNASVKLSPEGSPRSIAKPFLSALTAELYFTIDNKELTSNRPFMKDLDILDFPGLRPQQRKQEEDLSVDKNLSTVFRRGKVTYLFNKYSRTKRISSILFCHNNNQSSECTMGPVLAEWVATNVGSNESDRKQFITSTRLSPMMVISTWFNRDLDYNNETESSNLNERWVRRFKTILSKEVIQSEGPKHWFNSWTNVGEPFKSIFMLRDFDFSKNIFSGYDPDTLTPEQMLIKPEKFPKYMERLKESFVSNEFVRTHFEDPSTHWDAAATVQQDGTKPIIEHLNSLAPNVNDACMQKFNNDYNRLIEELLTLLHSEYHDDDPAEQTRKAKKEVGKIILNIDRLSGLDPYYWSRILSSMMIPERMIRDTVFSNISGNKVSQPLSKPEGEIFMAAGLSTDASAEENLRRLCDYLGADDRKECQQMLEEIDPYIEIKKLLEHNQMIESTAEQVLSSVEKLWQTDFLSERVAGGSNEDYMNIIVEKLVSLYKELNVHKRLVDEVQHLMDTVIKSKQVGIVTSWLTMSLNRFVGEFGYAYINSEQRRNVVEKNANFNLNIDFGLIDNIDYEGGIDLLQKTEKVQRDLEKEGFTSHLRDQQKELPQYRSRWQWQNRMRMAFAIVSGLRNYNIEANNEIKHIIESIN